MSTYLRLAWRNLWRNRKRSYISIASVTFAVFIAFATRSMQLGTYARLVDNIASFYTGYLQVQHPDYGSSHSLEDTFPFDPALERAIRKMPYATALAPRLEAFGLLSGEEVTAGALVIGIDPEREAQLTRLNRHVVGGTYLPKGSRGILLAAGLADYLNAEIGDTLVILSQGYRGVTAAGKFPLQGLVAFPTPDLNNRLAYLDLTAAQDLFAMPGLVTSVAVMLSSPKRLDAALRELRGVLSQDLAVLSWKDMMPEIVQYIEMDNASGVLMLMIVYLVIGCGMLSTVLMMTLERTREFGMLIAIGMSRAKLRVVVLLETLAMTLVGVAAGMVLSIPVLVYLYFHPIRLGGDFAEYMLKFGFEPILPFSLDPAIFIGQAISVALIALAVSLYPLWHIGRLKVAKALRSG